MQRPIASLVLTIFLFQLLSACTQVPSTQSQPTQQAFSGLALKPVGETAKVFAHFELAIDTDSSFSNPFDPAQADLNVRFTSPDGKAVLVPAFWLQDFDPQTLTPKGTPGWRVRFTPDASGEWTARAELTNPTLKSEPLIINVAANPEAHGFLRINKEDPRYFALDDGSFFFPVGLNIAWSTGDVLKDYTSWLDQFSQNGGNFIRVWMASWSFGLEWKETGLGNYSARLKQAWLLDQVLTLAEDRGIYVELCLINHGAFSESTNAEWASNPYNIALGGPLKTPGDFVTDPTARDLFKRRLRYTVARWAAYPSLGVWEWWNEINWTPINDDALAPWITEMTNELQKYDPYNHLRSTSYANGIDNKIWSMAELDFAQQHDYSASDPASTLSQNLAKIQKNSGDKPAVLAEHGNSDDGNTPFNKGGTQLHNGLWAAPFSGYASTAMYWWWDNYIDPSNLWFQYKGISEFMKDEDLTKMTPSQVETSPSGGIVSILSKPDHALIWVRDENYNMHGTQLAYYKDKNPSSNWIYSPAPLEGLSFTLNGLQEGRFLVAWYSTIDGLPTAAPLEIAVKDGSVTIDVPRFQIDLALKIVKAP